MQLAAEPSLLWGDLPDGLANVGDGGGNSNGGVEKNAHCDGSDVFGNYLIISSVIRTRFNVHFRGLWPLIGDTHSHWACLLLLSRGPIQIL